MTDSAARAARTTRESLIRSPPREGRRRRATGELSGAGRALGELPGGERPAPRRGTTAPCTGSTAPNTRCGVATTMDSLRPA
ncbi:MAG: hypothetical protein ACYCTE_13280, partial [Acidimicrobiales bacterium]